jgi:hypothetical protein
VCATLTFKINERSGVALAAVMIYHGQSVEAFTCPECVAVYAAAGAKWHLLYRFTLLPEWQQYRQQYAAIMLPDDDLQVMHRGTQACRCGFKTQTSFDGSGWLVPSSAAQCSVLLSAAPVSISDCRAWTPAS